MDPGPYKKCAFCGAALEEVEPGSSGEFRCRHCGVTCRFDAENLVAIFIPNYYARLAELEGLNRELVREIELEGIKGDYREMRYIQKKHLERQSVLAEYSHLSYWRTFVEKW